MSGTLSTSYLDNPTVLFLGGVCVFPHPHSCVESEEIRLFKDELMLNLKSFQDYLFHPPFTPIDLEWISLLWTQTNTDSGDWLPTWTIRCARADGLDMSAESVTLRDVSAAPHCASPTPPWLPDVAAQTGLQVPGRAFWVCWKLLALQASPGRQELLSWPDRLGNWRGRQWLSQGPTVSQDLTLTITPWNSVLLPHVKELHKQPLTLSIFSPYLPKKES